MTNPKIHVALNVNNVKSSIEFYRAMFGVKPTKCKPRYAKFDIDQPALNLALNEGAEASGLGALNHLGIEVASTADVLAARQRLREAGLETTDEMNIDCCFALQDKIWITDPDGYRWEIFTVKVQDTQPDLTIQQSPQTCCQS